tara:strand:+ start:125 stop:331 length:207 start_codon:yes stop_codon:yes gene_type:complete
MNLLKKVMSLHNKVKKQTDPQELNLKLSKEELEVILSLLANGTFQGSNVETIYKLAIKLQTNYDKLNK